MKVSKKLKSLKKKYKIKFVIPFHGTEKKIGFLDYYWSWVLYEDDKFIIVWADGFYNILFLKPRIKSKRFYRNGQFIKQKGAINA